MDTENKNHGDSNDKNCVGVETPLQQSCTGVYTKGYKPDSQMGAVTHESLNWFPPQTVARLGALRAGRLLRLHARLLMYSMPLENGGGYRPVRPPMEGATTLAQDPITEGSVK